MTRTIHITTSMPLGERIQARIEDWLQQRYGQHTTVWHIDDSLLGGILIFDGERVFDGSLKSKLDNLKV